MRQILVGALVAVATGACVNVSSDPGETGTLPAVDGPTVEFDPANSIIPFPNNLTLSTTTGKVAIPAACGEGPATTAVRVGTLNQLSGFGTYETVIYAQFSQAVDPTTAASNIVMYERMKKGVAVPASSATAIPLTIIGPSTATVYIGGCTGTTGTVTQLNFAPSIPLDEDSIYTVAITNGINTSDGTAFIPSATWALISGKDAPVTFDASGNVTSNRTPLDPNTAAGLAQLQGLAGLYAADAPLLTFLDGALGGKPRTDILLAWDFVTQPTTDVLNPAVAGSPGAQAVAAATGKLLGTQSITGGATPTQFIEAALKTNAQGCLALGCGNVQAILGGAIATTNFQVATPNPGGLATPVPGQWSDPVNPTVQPAGAPIPFLLFVPNGINPNTGKNDGAVHVPAAGWPVVVFGHGLGNDKSNLVAIGAQLASAGYASIAIDFVASGPRSVQTSNAAALKCDAASAPTPGTAPQCYAQILTTDLGVTRDNIRQTVLDLLTLTQTVKNCGTAGCAITGGGTFPVNTAKLAYVSLSLGSIIGSTLNAVSTDFKAAVLNVSAVGLLDVLENTANLTIRCGIVDGLIAAGVVTGTPFDPVAMTGTCTTLAWEMQPGYQQFAAIARWVLDPADGANFTGLLATHKVLLQEVVDDQVVPNIGTDHEGALLGLTPGTAAMNTGTAAPSPNITAGSNLWVRYTTFGTADAGNAYQHASLLEPVEDANGVPTTAGLLGTAQVQTDAITFLATNNPPL